MSPQKNQRNHKSHKGQRKQKNQNYGNSTGSIPDNPDKVSTHDDSDIHDKRSNNEGAGTQEQPNIHDKPGTHDIANTRDDSGDHNKPDTHDKPNSRSHSKGRSGKGSANLTDEEIKLILRGADSIIGTAGRSMLAKILKGSKDKRLLQHAQEMEIYQNPAYASLSQHTLAEITDMIDWMVRRDYLEIEYEWKMPVIVFSEKGWEIEREERADEFLRQWDVWIENNVPVVNMNYLKDRNRGLITLFLDKIMATNNPKYLPLLRKWEPIDYKKVRAMIRKVIRHLESCKTK